jgi:polyisoprenyl-teichoic acid--peptidoglycan teichoic acid transferase
MRRPYWVVFGLGLIAVGMGFAARWLFGDFGALDRGLPESVAQPPPAPVLPVDPIVSVSSLPLEIRQPPLTGTQNYLIAGLDRRPGNAGSGLTDTLILVAIEKKTGRVGLISVPRDTAVEIPRHGLNRINIAYALARARSDDAVFALKRVVSDLLGLPIQHAIVVDISMFEQLVDALGGVSVDVPCPIIDNFVDSRTPNGRRLLDVKAGSVRMDGITAAMYVRSRHGRSDFSRARRQQALLSAIHRELLGVGGWGRIPEVWSTIERNVATDFKHYELLDLARRVLGLKLEQVHGLVFSDEQLEQRFDHGRALLFPKLDAMDSAVQGLYSAPKPGTADHLPVCPPADIALQHRRAVARDTASDAGLDDGSPEPESGDSKTKE